MNKPLLIMVGASGSGKTTLCEALASVPGFRRLQTSTSRPARGVADAAAYHRAPAYELKTSAVYVLKAEFDEHAYAVHRRELDDVSNVLILTGQPAILVELKHLCTEYSRRLIVVHLKKAVAQRAANMQARGDTAQAIEQRLANDNLDDQMSRQPVAADITIDHFISTTDFVRLMQDALKSEES